MIPDEYIDMKKSVLWSVRPRRTHSPQTAGQCRCSIDFGNGKSLKSDMSPYFCVGLDLSDLPFGLITYGLASSASISCVLS